MTSLADDTRWLDATDQAALVRSGQVSSSELLQAAIARIEIVNPVLNAVVMKWFDDARSTASVQQTSTPFAGVPFLLKDLVATFAGKPLASGNIRLKEAAIPAVADSVLVSRFRAEATAETIEPDGWLHTGDVAKHDGLGHFFVVERLKDMILTGGYNVYPAEIERILIGHDAVALVAVGREPDEVKGEVAHAYVVLATGQTATESELIEYCHTLLASYKVPRAVHFVDTLPTTSSGKLMRRKLRELREESNKLERNHAS